MAKKLTFLDKAFWITETKDSPKHVAGLQLLMLPEGEDFSYITNLVTEMKGFTEAYSPFSDRVVTFLGFFPLKLKTVDSIDMDYHVRFHEIDDVDDEPALHQMVADLHAEALDRKHPLWQYHIIGSKKSRRFCIYTKVHHMYGDGASLVRWFQAGLSEEPDIENFKPVWAVPPRERKRRKANPLVSGVKNLWYLFLTLKDLAIMLILLFAKLIGLNRHYMPLPFSGKKTVLTGQVKKGRTIATANLPMDRVFALSKRVRATVNEILLTSFDIGVHRFLKDHGHTFDKPLITQMPINLRRPGETTMGNKIGIALVELAHGKKDPYQRLQQIITSHKIVKRSARTMYPAAFSYYTILWQSVALIFELCRLSGVIRPLGNILISNVPGPEQTMYYRDCLLEATYPISAITPGGGVNITLLTYRGVANIGLVCPNAQIKSLEPMARYFEEAFELLEHCVDHPEVTMDDIGEIELDVKSIVMEHRIGDAQKEDEISEDQVHTHT